MNIVCQIKNRNKQDWKRTILNAEISRLQREERHLSDKSNERALSHWEMGRVASIQSEIQAICEKIQKHMLLQLAARIEMPGIEISQQANG